MSNLMHRGEDSKPTDKFADTPFKPFHKVRTWNDKEALISHAENSLHALTRAGSMSEDELRNAAIGNDHQSARPGYWSVIAALVATAEGVDWRGGFELTSDAPAHGSDEWEAAASKLEIPDTRAYDGVPKAVSHTYKHLEKIRRWNDGDPRPCHRIELKSNAGVHMPDRRFARVWAYLSDLPGVESPDNKGPMWVYDDADETATDTADGGEANA